MKHVDESAAFTEGACRNLDRSDRDVVVDIDQLVEEVDASLGIADDTTRTYQSTGRPQDGPKGPRKQTNPNP